MRLEDLRTGDIVFRETEWWFAKTIQKVAKVEYNHTGVIVVLNGIPCVVEAVPSGVHLVTFENWNKGVKTRICRPARIINEEEYIVKALSVTGNTAYDYIGVTFRQGWYNVTGRYIGKMSSKELKSFYCYELVAWMNEEDVPEWHKALPKHTLYANWHYIISEGTWENGRVAA